LIEFYVSPSGDRLCLPVTEMVLDEGAHLAYHAIQQLGAADWQLAYQLSRVARDAELRSFSAALGGSYARLFTRSELVGEGAESRLAATYLAKGTQVQDLRTFQEHAVARTTSDLVFKGAVRDHARSVYSGMIHMAKGARRAVAAQTNRNLVLSEGAHADSVPNLDIEENDVRCSHASAVGPIDAEQRFYLESRGVPTETANRLILLGFFDDLFDEVPSPGCAAYLRTVFTREIESGAV
jgi:Fe-S cluster assembly protein SufD